ncbi:MAG: hypothetical protein PHQ86_09595 [Dehalococcoidales bacterium]|nr:hypothetical protein [Dehalococcoidales bacterium]
MVGYKWESNFPNLSKTIINRGLKLEFLAGTAGLTYNQLWRRLSLVVEFGRKEMQKIADVLNESMDYLFGNHKKI